MFEQFFQITSLVLLVLQITVLIPLIVKEYNQERTSITVVSTEVSEFELPDIYYIVLDGHARQDVLSDLYSVDSTSFYNGLEERGFYVASKSRSNYPQTFLTQASTLNMQYLDELSDASYAREKDDLSEPKKMIQDNDVARLLKRQGYRYILLSSLWSGIDQNGPLVDEFVRPFISVNEYVSTLIAKTPVALFMQESLNFNFNRNFFRQSIAMLTHVAEDKRPTFTYAHFVKPHPPFVFDINGDIPDITVYIGLDAEWKKFESHTAREYIRLYRDQVQYIDSVILKTIDQILARSIIPPIIILQSDHGPASRFTWDEPSDAKGLQERFSILNAYYFPDGDYSELYDTITPVNSFRIILNKYFGETYERLSDESYFSSFYTPYYFYNVTEILDTYEQ